jgi:hypothetical protein
VRKGDSIIDTFGRIDDAADYVLTNVDLAFINKAFRIPSNGEVW